MWKGGSFLRGLILLRSLWSLILTVLVICLFMTASGVCAIMCWKSALAIIFFSALLLYLLWLEIVDIGELKMFVVVIFFFLLRL